MTTSTAPSKLISRDALGITYMLLSGTGVVFLPTTAAMITLIEPPMAAVFAWLIFGETFTLLQWVGFAVVLAALVMFEKLARNHR